MNQSQLLFTAIPALFALFALALGALAMLDRGLRVARWGAIAFALGGIGLFIGMYRPPGAWWGLLYVHLAVLGCYGQAMAARSGGRVPGLMVAVLIGTAILATLNRLADVPLNMRYIVFNAGAAVALALLLLYQYREPHRRRSDRLLIGATIFLLLTYLARIALLVFDPLADSVSEASSFFDVQANIFFSLIMALGGAVTGLAILMALGWDMLAVQARRARTDALTGLGNRLALLQALREERQGEWDCSGAIAIDLDHFKRINDTHGHLVGDRLLIEVGRVIRELAGDQCKLIRSGGEEFLILACHIDEERLARLADDLRREIALITIPDFPELRPSASVGYSVVLEAEPVEEAIRKADEALYAAKRAGRNRISSFEALSKA